MPRCVKQWMSSKALPPFVVSCLVAAIIWVVPRASAGIELTQDEIRKLASGNMVIRPMAGSRQGSKIAGMSFAVINASPERVWKVFEDVSKWDKIFYNVLSAGIVAKGGGLTTVKMIVGNKLLTFDFHLTVKFDREKLEAHFALSKNNPGDVEEVRSWIRFLPQPGGRTLVAFFSVIKVPFGAILKLFGDRIMETVEFRILAVPMRLKKQVEGW